MHVPVALVRRARDRVVSLRPEPGSLRADSLAAVPGAIGSVPDGMASGILAGVSPAHGLYASIAGPVGGGLTVSTKLMVVTTTSAAALAAGGAISGLPAGDRASALALVTFLAGIAMALAALIRLGRFTRFVSHSVMTGFLSGVAINIILGQLSDLTGAEATGAHPLQKAIDLFGHLSRVDLASLATGLGALVILGSTRSAVVVRLRGRTAMGATFVTVTVGYARRLQEQGGHLFLSGVSPELEATLRRTAAEELDDSLTIVDSEPVIGASTRAADHAARQWLQEQNLRVATTGGGGHRSLDADSPGSGDPEPPSRPAS